MSIIRISRHGWEVVDVRGVWMGRVTWVEAGSCQFRGVTVPFVNRLGGCETGYLRIMPTSQPYELAVDALLDFIDRLHEGRIPRGVDDPDVLMEICASAARRQR